MFNRDACVSLEIYTHLDPDKFSVVNTGTRKTKFTLYSLQVKYWSLDMFFSGWNFITVKCKQPMPIQHITLIVALRWRNLTVIDVLEAIVLSSSSAKRIYLPPSWGDPHIYIIPLAVYTHLFLHQYGNTYLQYIS